MFITLMHHVKYSAGTLPEVNRQVVTLLCGDDIVLEFPANHTKERRRKGIAALETAFETAETLEKASSSTLHLSAGVYFNWCADGKIVCRDGG